jgi:hypothetical protein
MWSNLYMCCWFWKSCNKKGRYLISHVLTCCPVPAEVVTSIGPAVPEGLMTLAEKGRGRGTEIETGTGSQTEKGQRETDTVTGTMIGTGTGVGEVSEEPHPAGGMTGTEMGETEAGAGMMMAIEGQDEETCLPHPRALRLVSVGAPLWQSVLPVVLPYKAHLC